MSDEEILILLSTYNGEKYLKEQLDSLFSQSYKNFKLIVRDDGSTDGTKEILHSYDIELLSSSENLETLSSSMWRSEYINPRANTLNKLLIHVL